MPYPKKLLNDGEEVALDLRPHWWFFSKHIASGIPLFVVAVLILAKTHDPARKWLFVLWAIVAVAWAGWLAVKYLEWNFTHFVVTDDRVIYRTGVLAKRGVEIPMERINNINFHQGVWERMIGAGDLDIESAGRDGQSHFDDVWHPDGVQQELYRQMEANAKKRASWANPVPMSAAAPSSNATPSVPEQLQQLADLRDRGVITAAEFETKKAQLLERM
ncbi:MAG TPA: PH domain-containing protein [Acidimicrobiia bacterium]|nr:PH domain-containing protein [Acidimicrobiia bacterium]